MESKEAPPPAYNQTGNYPQQGYPPPQQGFAPPQQGYAPPQQGYAPQQQGYPPGQPGYPGQPATVVVTQPYATNAIIQNRPPDYFVASILACLCCFWPTGLCAIYFASRSRSLLAEGNVAESSRMAQSARNLVITSVVIGIIWIVLTIVLRVVLVSSASTRTYKY